MTAGGRVHSLQAVNSLSSVGARRVGVVILSAAAVLVMAPAAEAMTKRFEGAAPDMATVSFKAVLDHGDATSVSRIKFKNVPVECSEDPEVKRLNYRFDPKVQVKANGRFHLRDGGVEVVGKFKSRKVARGTFTDQGKISGVEGCDTGEVKWRAERVRSN